MTDVSVMNTAIRLRSVLQQATQLSWDFNTFTKRFPLEVADTQEEMYDIISGYIEFLTRLSQTGQIAQNLLDSAEKKETEKEKEVQDGK